MMRLSTVGLIKGDVGVDIVDWMNCSYTFEGSFYSGGGYASVKITTFST